MTIQSRRSNDAAGRSRACALLGIAPDAAPEERRRAALAQLDRADYAPPPAWQDSIDFLFGGERQWENSTWLSKAALREEVECGLNDEIEAFVASFFSIEPAARRRRWADLCDRSRCSPVLARRLALLEPGLALTGADLEVSGQDRQGRLADWILRMFPLRPPARARLWLHAREGMRDGPPGWELAANELLRDRPHIARLVPELVDEARSLTAQQRRWERQVAARKRDARRQKWGRWRAALSPGGVPRWGIVVAVIVLLRIAGSSLQHADRSDKPTSGPSRAASEFRLDAQERKNFENGLEALRRIREFEEKRRSSPQPDATAPEEPDSPEEPLELKLPVLKDFEPPPEPRGPAP